jgi:hypothetical protein
MRAPVAKHASVARHPSAAKHSSVRLGFDKCNVSAGALIHGAGLVAGFIAAKKLEKPLWKVAGFAACTMAAGHVAKLLHQRETREEKKLLGMMEEELAL